MPIKKSTIIKYMNFQYSIIYTISIILEILIFGLVVSLSPPFVSLHFSSVGSYGHSRLLSSRSERVTV